MRYFFYILLAFAFSSLALPADSQARIFAAEGDQYMDINTNVNTADMNYSATWDANFPLIVCMYDRTVIPPKLITNEFWLLDNTQVLFGVRNPESCPLPGSKLLKNYPNAIAGEFLISGVVCIMNTIIFDSMFKVYCTIVLWFYNIIYAMIIIYIMFYGLAVMLGIGKDPLREAPMRILKIMLIFTLAVNAQVGFRYTHQFFLTMLNSFTDMLTDIQPMHTEAGQPAYDRGNLLDVFGVDAENLRSQGTLLDLNGNPWRPVANPDGATEYYDMEYYNYELANGVAVTMDSPGVKKTIDVAVYPEGMETVSPEEYVPFRVPTMQWTYAENPKGSGDYVMLPVFEEVTHASGIDWDDVGYEDSYACVFDVMWNAAAGRLEKFPRCQKNLWPTVPNISPYGEYCVYKIDSETGVTKPLVTECSGVADCKYCDTSDTFTIPPKLAKVKYSDDGTIDETALDDRCDGDNPMNPLNWFDCRQPFQRVIAKMDAIFHSVIGDDNAKTIGALIAALAMWGLGGGTVLSLLLMTGVLAMFTAIVQFLWTYITSIMMLTFLLMLSPIFISFALFKVTEKLFNGWLSSVISYTMQPFLIMAFIYILASMTSLDRLTELTKNEVHNKLYVADIAGEQGGVRFTAPAFIEPLYEKPADFDRKFNPDAVKTYKGAAVYITGAQRQQYLQDKGDSILANYVFAKTGTQIDKAHMQDEINKLDTNSPDMDASVKDLILNLTDVWVNGVYPVSTPAGSATNKRGMDAVAQFMRDNDGWAQFDEFIGCYKSGCVASGVDIDGLDPEGGDVDADDGDSFVGEPESYDEAGAVRGKEFPVCKKYCPVFKPSYDPNDEVLANPRINELNADGKQASWCTKYCMFVPGNKENTFRYLFSSIILWVMLNVVAGAFMSKVPELAQSLSKWQNYGGLKLGGSSKRSFGNEAQMDKWSREEQSGVYHMGGLFNLGIFGGRAGAAPEGVDKLMRTLAGPKYVVDSDGILREDKNRQPYYMWKGLTSIRGETPQVRIAKMVQEKMFGGVTSDRLKSASLSDTYEFYDKETGDRYTKTRADVNEAVRSLYSNDPKFSYMTADQIKAAIDKYLVTHTKPK
jgi:hypothetical protein